MIKNRSSSSKLGMAAIKMGFATKEQIEQAFKEQERLSAQGKAALISDILIDRKILTKEQRDEIIGNKEAIKNQSADQDKESQHIKDAKKVQDDSGFELTITPDKIEAFISPLKADLPAVGLSAIKGLLEKEGIRFGMIDDAQIAEYLASKPSKDKLWQIAQGKAPDPGKLPEVRYHFDTDPLKTATIDEDGNIDYKNRGEIPYVTVDDLLAEIIPGEDGKPGKDIYGEIALPPALPPVEILHGTGVKKIEEGNKAVAEMNGRPEVLKDGTLNVSDELCIPGDVGIETGHIEFDGHIKVKGSVQEGYRVKGKSLWADEILNAQIEMTEDIEVAKGIIGANILTDGKIKARHVRDTIIDALGDVIIEREVYESKIEANGVFDIGRGTILGSSISAMRGIEAAEVGSHAATPCRLTVGVDNRLEKAIAKINVHIEVKEKEKKRVHILLREIKHLPKRLEDEIGIKAQEQDQAIVKGRALKKTLESLQKSGDRDNMIKVVKIIKAMNKKLETLGKDIDALLKKQEKVVAAINGYEEETKQLDSEIQELRDDIKRLIELAKMNKSAAIVKVPGTIYDRTFIKGKHSALTVKGDVKRVRIQETRDIDESSDKKWFMSVSSL